jgi:hypothetical protein
VRGFEAEKAVEALTPGDVANEINTLLTKRKPGVPRALNNYEWKVLEKATTLLVDMETIARVFR